MLHRDRRYQKPVLDNGHCKWYWSEHFQKYLSLQQADNLPPLKGLGCFEVEGPGINDLTLIDDKQNVLAAYPNNLEGQDQMTCFINILKVSKHYDEHEQLNLQ